MFLYEYMLSQIVKLCSWSIVSEVNRVRVCKPMRFSLLLTGGKIAISQVLFDAARYRCRTPLESQHIQDQSKEIQCKTRCFQRV